MYFPTALIIAALPFLASAAPASTVKSYNTPQPPLRSGPISLIAAHSASPIHLSSINASGQAFWIGKETATYCPLTPASSCPPGNSTVIDVLGDTAHPGTASMDVVVPGGQQIYIRPNGALAYTQAHSAFIPPGSLTTGFTYTPGPNFGFLGITLPGGAAGGLLACPTGENATGPYQIWATIEGLKDGDVAGGDIGKCIGLDALAVTVQGASTWQYT